MKKLLAVLLLAAMLLSLAACGSANGPAETPAVTPENPASPETPGAQETPEAPAEPEPPAEPAAPAEPELPAAPETPAKPTDEEILRARREAAIAYMRGLSSVLWMAEEDIVYTPVSKVDPSQTDSTITIHGGQIYQGLPYSYAAGSAECWMEMLGEPDAEGIRRVSGVTWPALSGTGTYARLGVDCSSAAGRSWQSAGVKVEAKATSAMTVDNGFLRVGEYESPLYEFTNTVRDTAENGAEVMFAAYACLQPADLVVYRTTYGHTRMVVGVDVVREADGSINGEKSTVTVVEQTGGQRTQFNAELNKQVQSFFLVDQPYTFNELFADGYLPMTCREFTDPAPLEEPAVADNVTEPTLEMLFYGTLSGSRGLDAVTITITDAAGAVVQQCTARPARTNTLNFNMNQFGRDGEERLLGSVDPTLLPAGTYHCAVTARIINGDTYTAREFDFTV